MSQTNLPFMNYTPEGRIIQVGNAPNPLEQVWDDVLALVGEADMDLHYVLNGARADRPQIAAMPSASYDLSLLPAGTEVWVSNEVGDLELFGPADGTLTLDDPGTYMFDIKPPFPYQTVKTKLEIS